jgi:predicted nucleotidyltransferase component of viral defense system
MIDINRHKFFLVQVLKDIYSDPMLASSMGFKGGTALMLFHGLPRFSVDLDFNLIDTTREQEIYGKLQTIVKGHGNIRDEARKHYGLLLVLDYESGGRNLKLEVSSRSYPDEYELADYLGVSMKVMKLEYMFTHKLMALLDRRTLTNRDIFDCWFCMQRRVNLRKAILDLRLPGSFEDYIDNCITAVSGIRATRILDGMGELLDPNLKAWAKTNLVSEFVTLARLYKEMPLIK